MLIGFGVSNYRSLRENVEISLLADTLIDGGPLLLPGYGGGYQNPNATNRPCLPFILVHGEHAREREDLIRAMAFMIKIVRYSDKSDEYAKKRITDAFARVVCEEKEPTRLWYEFAIDDIRYNYGFTLGPSEILTEWLHCYDGDRQNTLFHRDGNVVTFSDVLASELAELAQRIDERKLLLSLPRNTGGVLRKIYLILVNTHTLSSMNIKTAQSVLARTPDQRLVPFLKLMDPSVTGIFCEQETSQGDDANHGILVSHRDGSGRRILVRFENEPDSFQQFGHLLVRSFQALDRGTPLWVNDLERHIGSDLASSILGLFADWRINWTRAQLISTSCSTGLAQAPFVRADQIVFLTEASDKVTAADSSSTDHSCCNALDTIGPRAEFLSKAAAVGAIDRSPVTWVPPKLHNSVVGMTFDGKRYWTFRRKIKAYIKLFKFALLLSDMPSNRVRKILYKEMVRLRAITSL